MACFAPSSVVPTWLTSTATTTTANLSVPANLPGISDMPAIPKPLAKTPSKPFKTWAKPYPTPAPLSFPVESDWFQKKIGMELSRKKGERLERIMKKQQRKIAEA